MATRRWLLGHPSATADFLNATYLTLRRTYRELNADAVYAGLLSSLDLANPKPNVGNHGFTLQERAGFGAFIKAGFLDAFREFEKGGTRQI